MVRRLPLVVEKSLMRIGGVEMEEKGERYRDGDKVCNPICIGKRRAPYIQALRFYDRAIELYSKALGFSKTYDAAYNL